MTGNAKIKGTVEFLENLVENKVKFIVFCHHYEVLTLDGAPRRYPNIHFAGIDFSMPASEWGGRGVSNPRPPGPQPGALTN